MSVHALKASESVSIDGPLGAYATVRVDEIGPRQVTFTVFGHKSKAKEGQAPGPLTAETCDALLAAVIEARGVLSQHQEKVPGAMKALALLTRAEKAAASEVYDKGGKLR